MEETKTSYELAQEAIQQLLDSTTDIGIVKALSGISNNLNDLSHELKSKCDELERTNKSYNELKDDYISSVKHGGFNDQKANPIQDSMQPKDVTFESFLEDFKTNNQ